MCRLGVTSGAAVHQSVNERLDSRGGERGRPFYEWGLVWSGTVCTSHGPRGSGLRLGLDKSGDTLKKSVSMDTKIAHIIYFFLSEALRNRYLFPVIYLFLHLFVFLICPSAGFIFGVFFNWTHFPLIRSGNSGVLGSHY